MAFVDSGIDGQRRTHQFSCEPVARSVVGNTRLLDEKPCRFNPIRSWIAQEQAVKRIELFRVFLKRSAVCGCQISIDLDARNRHIT